MNKDDTARRLKAPKIGKTIYFSRTLHDTCERLVIAWEAMAIANQGGY